MMTRFALGTFVLVSLTLIGCGKMETMNRQANHRDDLGPELQGMWTTQCQGKKINSVTFTKDRLVVERAEYLDAECQERERTTRMGGTYKLAHNYKDGIQNSIVFHLDNDISVTFHVDADVDNQNSNLSRIQNEKESEIPTGGDIKSKKITTRENMKIRAAKLVSIWKRDEEKTLNRLQAEKLDAYGVNTNPVSEFGSRLVLKYEIDNDYLQIGGPSDFSRVFAKQK